MASAPFVPDPRALALPLRDVLRGVRAASHLPRHLRDAAGLLPAPFRDLARLGLGEVDRLLAAPDLPDLPEPLKVAEAAAALRGAPDAPEAGRAHRRLGRVFAAATDRAMHLAGTGPAMASETLVALAAARVGALDPATGDPGVRAARLVLALEAAHAAGPLPGTPVGSEASAEGRRRALAAAAVWLLAERAPEDEEGLLTLAHALVAVAPDAGAADEAALGVALADLARRL